MTCHAYCRVSTTAQAEDGESLALQLRQIEGYAMIHGLTVANTFEERGVSGSLPLAERPEGARMWSDLKRGDVIIAAKLDRMFRSARDALNTVEELRLKGVSLVLIDLGGDVMGNGLAKLFLTMTAAFAEVERDRIRERVQASKKDGKARGRYLGGILPFGFKVGADGALEPIPEEQAILADVRSWKADGKPLRTICADVQAKHGRKISLGAVHRIANEAAPA